MSKRLEFLWKPWDLPVSVQVRTVGRHKQELASCATGEVAQFSRVSQQAWKIRKNRETQQIRTGQCQPALISRSKEAVGVAGENH